MRYALPLGLLSVAAFAWTFGSVQLNGHFALGSFFQVLRCAAFALAAAAVWRLHWVRRMPLVAGLALAAASDILPLFLDLLALPRSADFLFEAVEAGGTAWMGWIAFRLVQADGPGLYGLRGAIALQTATALYWMYRDLRDGPSPFTAGNGFAIVGGLWFVAVAKRHVAPAFARAVGEAGAAAGGVADAGAGG